MLKVFSARPAVSTRATTQMPQAHSMLAPVSSSPRGDLRIGAVVRMGQHTFRIVQRLGTGSFSTVWAATRADGSGGEVAIKETLCRSQGELADAEYECNIVQQIGGASGRIPEHLASEAFPSAPGVNTVRLAMTQVPGDSLGAFLNRWKKPHRAPSTNPQVVTSQLGEACFWARELITQLLPAFEALAPYAVHRDVNTHNLLVHTPGGDTSQPQFGLVDFGLAIEAQSWERKLTQVAVVGDCRYWPVSAWYIFAAGGSELAKHAPMLMEYRTQLDVHAFGVTALQLLVEMLPEPVAGSAAAGALPEEIRDLKRAWEQYWMDAYRFWEPLYHAFEMKTDWNQLRQSYLANSVHKVISKDLGNVRQALSNVCDVCARADAGALSSFRPLFTALLKLISQGGKKLPSEPAPEFATWQSIRSILNNLAANPNRSGVVGQRSKSTFPTSSTTCKGSSTTSPSFSPSFVPPPVSFGTSTPVPSPIPVVLAASTSVPRSYTAQHGLSLAAMVPFPQVVYVA